MRISSKQEIISGFASNLANIKAAGMGIKIFDNIDELLTTGKRVLDEVTEYITESSKAGAKAADASTVMIKMLPSADIVGMQRLLPIMKNPTHEYALRATKDATIPPFDSAITSELYSLVAQQINLKKRFDLAGSDIEKTQIEAQFKQVSDKIANLKNSNQQLFATIKKLSSPQYAYLDTLSSEAMAMSKVVSEETAQQTPAGHVSAKPPSNQSPMRVFDDTDANIKPSSANTKPNGSDPAASDLNVKQKGADVVAPKQPQTKPTTVINKAVLDAAADKKKTEFQSIARKLGVSALGKALLSKYVIGAAAIAGIAVWWFYYRDISPDQASKELADLSSSLLSLENSLSVLKFKDGSDGQTQTQELISKIQSVRTKASQQLDEDGTKDLFESLMDLRSGPENSIATYLANSDSIKKDLLTDSGWDQAIEALTSTLTSIEGLIGKSEAFNASNQAASTKQNTGKAEKFTLADGKSYDVYFPSAAFSSNPKFGPMLLEIKRTLQTPVGTAFVDPDPNSPNGGRGFLTGVASTEDISDISNRIAAAAQFMFRKRFLTPMRLREFMLKSLSDDTRIGRKVTREVIRYYQGRGVSWRYRNVYDKDQSDAESIKESAAMAILMKKESNSINNQKYAMRKTADKISDSYFDGVKSSTKDKSALSYLSGLQGMYKEKAERRESDMKTLYMLHDQTGADTILSAHPKSIMVAESMGRGGIVENALENHSANRGVALSVPTGNYHGKYASVISQLTKLANEADDAGEYDASDLIDTAINELVNF